MLNKLKVWWRAELIFRDQLITLVAIAAGVGGIVITATWILLHGWGVNWNAVGSLASAAAAIIAIFASVFALRAPQKQQGRDRAEATREILQASGEAVALFRDAKKSMSLIAPGDEIRVAAAKARHIRNTLDRLLNRPTLTDGSIITGEGAISLMNAILEQDADFRIPSTNALPRRAVNHLNTVNEIDDLVTGRAQCVAAYAVERRWPGWERRFAKISDVGLMAALADDQAVAEVSVPQN